MESAGEFGLGESQWFEKLRQQDLTGMSCDAKFWQHGRCSSVVVCAANLKPLLTCALMLFFALSSAAQTQYFPGRAFCESQETGTCERWYAKHLRAMREPSLWELSKDTSKQSYRFLWLRTFHHPVSARLEVAEDGTAHLFVKVLSGQGGYEPGHAILNRDIKVPKDAVDHFLDLLRKADFWNLPTEQQESNVVNLDGAQWIMEGVLGGRYHVVDRWSPDEGPFRKAALFLAINLGDLNPRYQEVY